VNQARTCPGPSDPKSMSDEQTGAIVFVVVAASANSHQILLRIRSTATTRLLMTWSGLKKLSHRETCQYRESMLQKRATKTIHF
jgi:hypothetical protein